MKHRNFLIIIISALFITHAESDIKLFDGLKFPNNGNNPNAAIEQFSFETGGKVEVSVLDFKHIPHLIDISNNSANGSTASGDNVFVSVCSLESVRNFFNANPSDPSAKNKDVQFINGICSNPTICEYSTSMTDRVGDSAVSFSTSYDIIRTDVYYTILLQCSSIPVVSQAAQTEASRVQFRMSNPGIYFLRYLDVTSRYSFYFRCSFLIIWIVLFASFLSNEISLSPKSRLHSLLASIPLTRLLYLVASITWDVYNGSHGVNDSYVITHLPDALAGVNAFLLYTLLMLISKGYSIIRTTLSPIEYRSIYATALCMGIAESLFSFNSSASILLITFTVTTYMYLFNTMRMHLETYMYHYESIKRKYPNDASESTCAIPPLHRMMHLADFVDRPWYRMTPITTVVLFGTKFFEPLPSTFGLKFDLNDNFDLLGPYSAKLWLMSCIQRLITYFCAITILIRLATFLQIFDGSAFAIVSTEISLIIGWAWMAYLFRTRRVFQTIEIPGWIFREKVE